MKIYSVGGAVRDELLGLKVSDRDYVVVGATPEDMQRLGYQPVGKDFPVFLHPKTHEEYALARTERKTARGYKGFKIHTAPDVTLEQDLSRRDLTLNAIARDEHGKIIDPFGGVRDLQAGILRHVSPAFAEDPVRILRVARFAARFGFRVAKETMVLMRKMSSNGEVDALVAERVWQELAKGLLEARPSRLFAVLRECGALAKILPELDRRFGMPRQKQADSGANIMRAIDYAAARNFSLPVRFAALTHDLGAQLKALCKRLRAPAASADLALLVARHHADVQRALELDAADIVRLLQAADALRKPQRFREFLDACSCNFHGRPGYVSKFFPQIAHLLAALRAAQGVDAGKIAKELTDGRQIASKVRQARLAAVQSWLAGVN
ncbi:MAG: hypothetical protein ACREUV_02815 [Burkholderiales bacterium]